MPAIQPDLLRQQASLLALQFNNPTAFVHDLHQLLDLYADRARRPGQSGKPEPLIDAYRVHPPVLRQIFRDLIPQAEEDPQQALALCDALWEQAYLEFRLLTAMLLGQLSSDYVSEVLARIRLWITPKSDDTIIEALLRLGLARLRQEAPQAVMDLIAEWFEDTRDFYKQLGLRALLPMIEDPSFENLPNFFRLIHPLTIEVPPVLRPNLLDVLEALARRSPQETAYFLRNALSLPDNKDTAWLIRQSMDTFPADVQASLRKTLRSQEYLARK